MSEALEKAKRRDLRRAFGGDAVETLNRHAAQITGLGSLVNHAHGLITGLTARVDQAQRNFNDEADRVDGLSARAIAFEGRSFRQRWRWLLRGR